MTSESWEPSTCDWGAVFLGGVGDQEKASESWERTSEGGLHQYA